MRLIPSRVGTLSYPDARISQTRYDHVTSAPVLGNVIRSHAKATREGERTAMPFWLVAVLSAVGAVAIVWVLYLLARRWM
jgi:hypothetical protein